jgi:ParB-like chromosome segregation protein Spo0J
LSAGHELELSNVKTSELRTFHLNPRKGDVASIRTSLRVNGQYRPIVANRGTHTGRKNEVLAGNHTLLAARDEGWERIAVTWVDVDDDQCARIVAADNRTADLGSYDDAALVELLSGLDDLAGTGYDADALAELAAGLADPDFDPEDDVARLDRHSVTECPNCGHVFEPATRSVTAEPE